MKLLTLGIDGGDLELFSNFKMPFLTSLIEKNKSIKLEEDLFSRGWIEIISGKHARENGGFYVMPKADGTMDFNFNYSFDDLKKNISDPLIWEFAEKKGCKIGIMNIPTTYPSPDVNGFFVSGAGGGLNKIKGIPLEMCSNESIREILQDNGYILDIRLTPSGIKEIDELFNKLEEMMIKRTKLFIELLKKYKADYAFIVFRAPVIIEYLAMSEIDAIKKNNYSNIWKDKLDDFFSLFDSCIEDIFKATLPDNFIITADHGMVNQRYHVNFNNFLQKNGYQKKEITIKEIIKLIAKKIIFPLQNIFGYHNLRPSFLKINRKETSIFGVGYYNGLYINDQDRFGGPVQEKEIEKMVDEVCITFNKSIEAKKYNMYARPYRRYYSEAKFNRLLPDIWVDAPNDFFFFGLNKNFIDKNPWFDKIKNIHHIPNDMFTGTKGKNPICIMNEGLAKFINKDDEKNLTLIYKITKRYFENYSI